MSVRRTYTLRKTNTDESSNILKDGQHNLKRSAYKYSVSILSEFSSPSDESTIDLRQKARKQETLVDETFN